eukprot:COSAG06_NODE_10664_length_1640_cov_1.369241_1_plen_374_part_01
MADSFSIRVDDEAFAVTAAETMGAVKQRMAAQVGLAAEQVGALLGAGGHASNDGRTVGAVGVLTPQTSVELPFLAAPARCQYGGRGKFEPVFLELAKGQLTFRAAEGGAEVRAASVVGCSVAAPRRARRAHEFAFRLDLAQKDTAKASTYIVALSNAAELIRWMRAVGAYSRLFQGEVEACTAEARGLAERAAGNSLRPGEQLMTEDEVDADYSAGEAAGGGFDILLDGTEFHVNPRESMGQVKRRMAVSTGLTYEQLGQLLGSGDDAQETTTAGLTGDTCVQLPQCGGTVECQYAGERKSHTVYVELSQGKIVFRESATAKEVLRTSSALGCRVDVPKRPRKGRAHVFRVDLAKRDTERNDKYIISVPDALGV